MIINWDKIKKETIDLLIKFIQTDTSNPPGNEMNLVRIIENICITEGLHYKIIETDENRGNIIISLDETFRSSTILLSHLDVVPSNSESWKHDPFLGYIDDEFIWGRGALDTKHLTVMELMSLILIKRNNIKTKNIVMIATADEERGSNYGMKAILNDYSSIFKNSYVISEGGGFPIVVNGKIVYLCECGQKGHGHIKIWFEKGKDINPYYSKNEMLNKCTKLINKIYEMNWDTKIPSDTVLLIDKLYGLCDVENNKNLNIDEKLKIIEKNSSSLMSNLLYAMIKNTFAITKWQGGKRRNIEDNSVFEIDLRTLPGITYEMVDEKIKKIIDDTGAKYEIISFSEGYSSESNSELFKIFENNLKKELNNDCILLPFIAVGGSDGRLLREYNSKVYGFSPTLTKETFEKVVPLVHGVNERISIDSLLFGTKIIFNSLVGLN